MSTSSTAGQIETQFFSYGGGNEPVRLQSGETLEGVTLAYETYGELNSARDNAILVFHALSGSQHAAGYNPGVPGVDSLWTGECELGWWDRFIGPGKAFNTDRFFVICVNYLGGCYGSTGPGSTNPATGAPYGSAFPELSLSDIVDSQVRLLDHLGIENLHAVTGGSLGGMMCLSFSTRYPERVKIVAPIATSLYATTLHRIHNFEQIYAIEQDPHFKGGDYYGGRRPNRGLALARMIAHKTYVSLYTREDRARDEVSQPKDGFRRYRFTHPIESYMLHHGNKFVKRFDANSYLRIAVAWLRFDLLREAGASDFRSLLSACRHQRYMVFSIDSDVCFYPEEQREMVRELTAAEVPCRHITVHSEKGHDAFLLEPHLFAPHLIYSLESEW